MSSRREFLKQTAIGAAWLGAGAMIEESAGLGILGTPARAAEAGVTVVTILHTNDVHSRIDPFPPGQGRYAGLAGASRRGTLVRQIRAENPNSLLLDAGDTFQGTPYFNLYHGEVDFRVMSALGYDAMAVGNHEFDAGMEGLAAAARHARFPLLCANYDVAGTVLAELVHPFIVRQVAGVRIGLFGLGVILEGLVAATLCRGVTYSDPLAAAREAAAHLRSAEHCDLVICLSHLGNEGYRGEPGDQQIARQLAGIDLIIGGHSHTFMDEPTRVRRAARETLVFQVGWAGINLGRVDFYMQAGKVLQACARAIPLHAAVANEAPRA